MSDQQLAGYIYLRHPSPPDPQAPTTSAPTSQYDSISLRSNSAVKNGQIATEGPRREDIARLLMIWLESVDGRRSPRTLKNPRFHPDILAQLGGLQRRIHSSNRMTADKVASKMMTLHIQCVSSPTVRFCASAVIGGRVRAIAGTTKFVRIPKQHGSPRSDSQTWRVETLQII